MDNSGNKLFESSELKDFVCLTDDTLPIDSFPVQQIVIDSVPESQSSDTGPRSEELPELTQETTEVAYENEYMKHLSRLLDNGPEDVFLTQLMQRRPQDVSKDVGGLTLLQRAARSGFAAAVSALLTAAAADPNAVTAAERTAPLVLAARGGHWDALEALLRGSGPFLDANATDAQGDSALHIAARAAQLGAVVCLLRRGADARRRNFLGTVPFGPEAARALLDRCVSCGDDAPGHELELTFDYRLLAPGPPVSHGGQLDNHLMNAETEVPFREMDFIIQMTECDETIPLLGHPVVVSFLQCKWTRVRISAYIAFILKLLYVLLVEVLVVCGGMQLHAPPLRYYSYIGFCTAICGVLLMILFNVWCDIFMCLAFTVTIASTLIISLKEDIVVYIVLAILSSCFILLLEYDRLPIFTYPVQLMKFVAKQFILFLIPFIVLILMLAVGLHIILFSLSGRVAITNNFESWSISVVETILIVVNLHSTLYPPSILFYIYLLVLACGSVILLNILIGLTISCMKQIGNITEEIKLLAKARKAYSAEMFHTSVPCTRWFSCIKFLTQQVFLFPSSENDRIGHASLKSNNMHLTVGGRSYTLPKNIFVHAMQIVKEGYIHSSVNDRLDSPTLQQVQEKISLHMRNLDEKVQERLRYLETKLGVFSHRQHVLLQSSLRSVDNKIESILVLLEQGHSNKQ